MTSSASPIRQLTLAARPCGALRASDFALTTAEVGEPADGELLVRPRWLSLDPLLRIRVSEAPLGGVLPTWSIGSPMVGPAVGEVVASKHADFPPGCLVEARLPWQDLCVVPAQGARRVPNNGLGPQTALGVLGLPGFTAYVGIHLLDALPVGAKVLVSGAAGSVGSLFGQLAKTKGYHVTGIASGRERCAYLTGQLGFDAALDRTFADFPDRLRAAGPFQAHLENVGGNLAADVLPAMGFGATVLLCGLMAQYDRAAGEAEATRLDTFLEGMMGRQLTVRAYSAQSRQDLFPAFLSECTELVRNGQLQLREIVTDGLENVPDAFVQVFANTGIGKRLVRLDARAPVRSILHTEPA